MPLCYTCSAELTGSATKHSPACPRPQWQEPIPLPEAIIETDPVPEGRGWWLEDEIEKLCRSPVVNGIFSLGE